VAPVGALSVYSCGGAEERKRCGGDAAAMFAHTVAPVGALSAAAAGLYGEWRGYSSLGCFLEMRRFRKDQMTRRDSVARRAKKILAATWLRPTTQKLGNNSFESPCGVAAFEVNSEHHTGARLLVRVCVGPELARCVHRQV
jgi:hypothetical protein